jgi:hypothetical protein
LGWQPVLRPIPPINIALVHWIVIVGWRRHRRGLWLLLLLPKGPVWLATRLLKAPWVLHLVPLRRTVVPNILLVSLNGLFGLSDVSPGIILVVLIGIFLLVLGFGSFFILLFELLPHALSLELLLSWLIPGISRIKLSIGDILSGTYGATCIGLVSLICRVGVQAVDVLLW